MPADQKPPSNPCSGGRALARDLASPYAGGPLDHESEGCAWWQARVAERSTMMREFNTALMGIEAKYRPLCKAHE